MYNFKKNYEQFFWKLVKFMKNENVLKNAISSFWGNCGIFLITKFDRNFGKILKNWDGIKSIFILNFAVPM